MYFGATVLSNVSPQGEGCGERDSLFYYKSPDLVGVVNKGFSILRHLQGKGCKTGLCGQAWSFPLFDPM